MIQDNEGPLLHSREKNYEWFNSGATQYLDPPLESCLAFGLQIRCYYLVLFRQVTVESRSGNPHVFGNNYLGLTGGDSFL